MKREIFAAFIALMPTGVLALSCLPRTVDRAFLEAEESASRFVAVLGILDFNESDLPQQNWVGRHASSEVTLLPAELRGKSLTKQGFTTPFHKPVTLALSCHGPWCASAQADSEVLVFVELGTDGGVVSANPCGGYLFDAPTRAMVETVESCFAGEACGPAR